VIYLASPYSHPDAAVRHERFRAACEMTAAMMRDGHLVYSPIVHSHPLSEVGLPGDWAFWAEHNHAMLERADTLAVLRLPGWEQSVGVAAELEIAAALRLPVRFEDGPGSPAEGP
jgi:hypothetical protein